MHYLLLWMNGNRRGYNLIHVSVTQCGYEAISKAIKLIQKSGYEATRKTLKLVTVSVKCIS